jgi:GNAT superfamily N-acetyltransferase
MATLPERRRVPYDATIRPLAPCELARLEDCAREFYAASRWLGTFEPERFRQIWTELLSTGAGVIFAALDHGAVIGAIGGIVHREIYGPRMIAEEFFWFVRPGARGAGVALYRRFEEWARAKGAHQLHMVHMCDSMPEKVARFYLRSGFEPAEIRYGKDL